MIAVSLVVSVLRMCESLVHRQGHDIAIHEAQTVLPSELNSGLGKLDVRKITVRPADACEFDAQTIVDGVWESRTLQVDVDVAIHR